MYYKSFPINIKNISSSHGSSKQSFRERLKENWLIIFFGSIKARDNRVLECRLQNALQNIELFSKEYLALHMWLLKLEKSVKKYHKIKVKEIRKVSKISKLALILLRNAADLNEVFYKKYFCLKSFSLNLTLKMLLNGF